MQAGQFGLAGLGGLRPLLGRRGTPVSAGHGSALPFEGFEAALLGLDDGGQVVRG